MPLDSCAEPNIYVSGPWTQYSLPSPPRENALPYASEVLPCSLHFAEGGIDLIVSYVYHGIVYVIILSPDAEDADTFQMLGSFIADMEMAYTDGYTNVIKSFLFICF